MKLSHDHQLAISIGAGIERLEQTECDPMTMVVVGTDMLTTMGYELDAAQVAAAQVANSGHAHFSMAFMQAQTTVSKITALMSMVATAEMLLEASLAKEPTNE